MRQSHTNANGNTDGHSYTHNYPTANAHAEDCSVAERASDSAAEAVSFSIAVIGE